MCPLPQQIGGQPEPVRKTGRGPLGSTLVFGVLFVMADVSWRVVGWLVGFLPPPLNHEPATEFFAPWVPAIITTCLVAWLLVRPNRVAVLVLCAFELLGAYASIQMLVRAAWAGARLDRQALAGHYSAVSTWYTESLHAALHLIAVVLLVLGLRCYRRAQREADRRAAILDAF